MSTHSHRLPQYLSWQYDVERDSWFLFDARDGITTALRHGYESEYTEDYICAPRGYLKGAFRDEQHRRASQASRDNSTGERTAEDAGGQGAFASAIAHYTAAAYNAGPPHFASAFAAKGARVGQTLSIRASDWIDPPKSPLPREKLAIGELVGHRAWWLWRGGSPECELFSLAMADLRWKPNEPMTDRTFADESIRDHNAVGVWSFKSPVDLDEEFSFHTRGRSSSIESYHWLVTGTISMWGTVIEHAKGYRAQYAKIRSLEHVWHGKPGQLEQLRSYYGLA